MKAMRGHILSLGKFLIVTKKPKFAPTHGCIFLNFREGGGWKVKDKS